MKLIKVQLFILAGVFVKLKSIGALTVGGGVLLFVATHLILFFPGFYGETFDKNSAGVFGDFVGGYFGTLISIFTLVTVLITYMGSVDYNKRKSFEDSFFQLLGLLANGVSDSTWGDRHGKGAYSAICNNWRSMFGILSKINTTRMIFDQEEVFRISYFLLYYGAGTVLEDRSTFLAGLSVEKVDALSEIIQSWKKHLQKPHMAASAKLLNGNQATLSSFFRQLYHLYNFIERECPEEDKKKFYGKIIRSCLTTHQQALLAVNIRSGMGVAWRQDGILQKYNPIKNVPNKFLSQAGMKHYFPDIRFDFEEPASGDKLNVKD